jgi:hypothetical protein
MMRYGIQSNPRQLAWTSSPKAYAELYIDDAALSCPLSMKSLYRDKLEVGFYQQGEGWKYDVSRPYVDWITVREILIEMDLINDYE